MTELEFFVPGLPKLPDVKRIGDRRFRSAQRQWADDCAAAGRRARPAAPWIVGPIRVDLQFLFPARLGAQYRAARPDELVRGILNRWQGVLFGSAAMVKYLTVTKRLVQDGMDAGLQVRLRTDPSLILPWDE